MLSISLKCRAVFVATAMLLSLVLFGGYAQAQGFEKHRNTIEYAAEFSPYTPEEMAALAYIESSFNSNAKSKRSSASGLFAITTPTWKAGVKKHGYKHGITLKVSKRNPRANALIAAELLSENQKTLRKFLKRPPTSGEIFLAHMLGEGGAKRLLTARGNRRADAVLPLAARNNPKFFYTKSGKARTARQVRDYTDWYFSRLAHRYDTRPTYFATAKL